MAGSLAIDRGKTPISARLLCYEALVLFDVARQGMTDLGEFPAPRLQQKFVQVLVSGQDMFWSLGLFAQRYIEPFITPMARSFAHGTRFYRMDGKANEWVAVEHYKGIWMTCSVSRRV